MVDGKRLPSTASRVKGKMRSVYFEEEACIGCGLRPGNCHLAHSRSKEIMRTSGEENLRLLLLSSNGDLGGRDR